MNNINFEKDQEEVLDRTTNLKSLADQVKSLRNLEDQLKIDEELLKNKKRDIEKISGEIIPTLLSEMGLSSLKLADGSAVEVKPYYAANISIKNREAAYNWLRENGLGDIIKNDKQIDYFEVERKEPDYHTVFEKFSPDFFLNASGAASVPFSFDDPLIDYQLNVINVMKMLEAIRIESPETAFINISSAAVYGTPSQLPVSEDADVDPISPYGWHKRHSELLCSEYANLYGLKTCSMRVFSAYGPGLRK